MFQCKGNLVRSGDTHGYLTMARVLTEEHAISKAEFVKEIKNQENVKLNI